MTITARAAEGKLYGSVGPREVSDALTAAGHEIAIAEIKMPLGATVKSANTRWTSSCTRT